VAPRWGDLSLRITAPACTRAPQDLELADLKATKAARRRQPEDDDDQSVRQRKVAADVRRCLVEVAMFDMTAVPVLHRTWTVNEVHMSRDLSVATVFWTATRPLSPDAEVRRRRRAASGADPLVADVLRPCPFPQARGGPRSQENLYLALLAFEGRIRYQLAKRLRLKRIPRLQLVRDTLDDAEAELEERFSRLEQESDRTAARRRRGRPPGRALDDLLTPEEQAAIDAIELPAEFRALVAEPAAPHDAGATRRAARRRTGSKPT